MSQSPQFHGRDKHNNKVPLHSWENNWWNSWTELCRSDMIADMLTKGFYKDEAPRNSWNEKNAKSLCYQEKNGEVLSSENGWTNKSTLKQTVFLSTLHASLVIFNTFSRQITFIHTWYARLEDSWPHVCTYISVCMPYCFHYSLMIILLPGPVRTRIQCSVVSRVHACLPIYCELLHVILFCDKDYTQCNNYCMLTSIL